MKACARASVDSTGALRVARGRCERFQAKYVVVKPGRRLSLQMHHHRAGHCGVVRGATLFTRRRENPGKTPLEIIEVQSGRYLGEDDLVRFDDRYGCEEGGHARHGNSNR
jgi:mannose-1-phosphate guanylyltransferase/mannose-6-phosphate isomerase